jgi:hypothetical protein
VNPAARTNAEKNSIAGPVSTAGMGTPVREQHQ